MRSCCAPVVLLAGTLAALAAAPLEAQIADTAAAPAPAPAPDYPSPSGAMLRSFVLPGWGQAAYGQYLRGGIYLAGHVGNSFMILKTFGKLREANDIEDARAAEVRRVALEQDVTDPDSIRARVNADPGVRSIRNLISSREEQREDWIAFGLFWLLISGADAFVTGHLADFPADIAATAEHRRLLIQVSVPTR